MSIVTSVILTMSLAEDGFDTDGEALTLAEVNRWLASKGKMPLNHLSEHMCTGKHPQSLTFGGGYNYFPEEEFVALLSGVEWEEPERVVLVMQPERGATLVWRPDR